MATRDADGADAAILSRGSCWSRSSWSRAGTSLRTRRTWLLILLKRGCRRHSCFLLRPESWNWCAGGGSGRGLASGLLLFLLSVTLLFENPLAAPGNFGVLIDFLKNLAIRGDLLMVVLWARRVDAN